MAAINLQKAYLLQLSGGRAWEIGPCEGADEELGSWVDEFSSCLGLMKGEKRTARKICIGRVLETNGRRVDCRSSFVPPLPVELPSEGWHEWSRSGAVLLRHPEVMDIFCGLYPSRSSYIERMRHALVPVFDEIIATGGVPIHGALVEWRGAGALLLGESGAGKSTSCRRLPSDWQVHSDDLCLVVGECRRRFPGSPHAHLERRGGWRCPLALLCESVRDRAGYFPPSEICAGRFMNRFPRRRRPLRLRMPVRRP